MAKVQQVIDHIREGRYDRAFTRLYAADTAALEKQKARYIQALEQFALYYGADREVTLYSPPAARRSAATIPTTTTAWCWPAR